MNPHLFDRKTDSFFGSLRYLGYVLLPAGILLGGSPLWSGADQVQMLSVGALLFLLGILFQSTYHGFQLDFKNRQVREYLSMFGLKTGKWAPLPAFQRVVLTSRLRSSQDHDHGHSHDHEPAAPVMWYTIGLFSQTEQPDYELRTDNQPDALKTLRLLSTELGIPAEDQTTSSSPASRL
ncbi:hypothetical protein ACFSC6_07850 [Rufibacter sediminis]|uniref:DUF304 domain-containing protein n=1 Tax=Rufibacter sediminis TaxID=2762756 RepID=A0ABR6VPY7_9BACT|nr:hypothetical protein [Rufibacter sediminis]MBC3539255.1 hypothetical protein [Rufibacter sediminis]